MATILEKTNSAYYPSFKSMFRNVVAGEPYFSMMLYTNDHDRDGRCGVLPG
jgi:hypothetical protein